MDYVKELAGDKPIFHMFDPDPYGEYGCGQTALALLTGVSPVHLRVKVFKEPTITDSQMVGFLKKHGFSVKKYEVKNYLTQKTVVTKANTMLISTYCTDKIATWQVLSQNRLYHNFSVSPGDIHYFLSYPLISAYFIHHWTWDISRSELLCN